MTAEEKVEVLIKNINIANFNIGFTDPTNESKIHDFHIMITKYIDRNNSPTFIEFKDKKESDKIIKLLLEELKDLSFRYSIINKIFSEHEKGYMFILFPFL